MTKAIFFDIDGTLYSFKTQKFSEKSIEALKAARANGYKLFIATGRHKFEIRRISPFDFDAYVSLNGAYCFNNQQVIFKNPIEKIDIENLIPYLKEKNFSCIFIGENEIFPNLKNNKFLEFQKLLSYGDYPVKPPETALNLEILQLITMIPESQDGELLGVITHCEKTRWHPLFADILPKGGGKKLGIKKVLEYYGISPDEIIAIGDGENDIDMLRLAGTGIAMGNASEEVKSHADFITKSVDEDGVFHALKHFEII